MTGDNRDNRSRALGAGLVALAVGAAVFAAGSLALAEEDWSYVYDEGGQRDPFCPLVTSGGAVVHYDAAVSLAEMSLEGVVTGSAGGGMAIINGTVVEPGGRVGAYVLRRVEADRVILFRDGQESELRLKKEE